MIKWKKRSILLVSYRSVDNGWFKSTQTQSPKWIFKLLWISDKIYRNRSKVINLLRKRISLLEVGSNWMSSKDRLMEKRDKFYFLYSLSHWLKRPQMQSPKRIIELNLHKIILNLHKVYQNRFRIKV